MVRRPRDEAALPVRERVEEEVDFDRVAIGARTIQRTHTRGPFVCSKAAPLTCAVGQDSHRDVRRYDERMTTHIQVLKIEGMSCGHCVKSVQKALDAVPGVTSAKVSVGHAEVHGEASREALKQAIEAADFVVQDAH